jgi:hypothetical protein
VLVLAQVEVLDALLRRAADFGVAAAQVGDDPCVRLAEVVVVRTASGGKDGEWW